MPIVPNYNHYIICVGVQVLYSKRIKCFSEFCINLFNYCKFIHRVNTILYRDYFICSVEKKWLIFPIKCMEHNIISLLDVFNVPHAYVFLHNILTVIKCNNSI